MTPDFTTTRLTSDRGIVLHITTVAAATTTTTFVIIIIIIMIIMINAFYCVVFVESVMMETDKNIYFDKQNNNMATSIIPTQERQSVSK